MIIIIIRSEEEDGQRVLKKGGIHTVTGRHIPITMRESHAPTQQREREREGGPLFYFFARYIRHEEGERKNQNVDGY